MFKQRFGCVNVSNDLFIFLMLSFFYLNVSKPPDCSRMPRTFKASLEQLWCWKVMENVVTKEQGRMIDEREYESDEQRTVKRKKRRVN